MQSVSLIGRRRFILTNGALFSAPLALAAAPAPVLRASAAECIVTPEPGALLVGPMKPAEGVHDDLHARVLLLDDGDQRVAIATLDYLGFDLAYTRRLVQAVAEAAGIEADQVLLNCSHTHNAPLTAPWGPWLKEKQHSFHRFLPERLRDITRTAAGKLQRVQASTHREPTQLGFNRRLLRNGRVSMGVNPEGEVLPWVDVLALRKPDGSLVASLSCHAAHPVIVHESSAMISGDYPGFAMQALRKKERGIHLFVQGCSGNINAFPLKGGIDAAKAAGGELAGAIRRALRDPQAKPAGNRLRAAAIDLELPHRPPPPVKDLERIIAKESNPGKRARREALLALARKGTVPTLPMPLRAFSLGPGFGLVAMAHEPFAEYHRFLDRISPFKHTFALAYTNGLEGYVGTARAYALGANGGYETSPFGAALMFERRLPLAAQAEEDLQAGLLRLLEELSA